MRQNIVLIDFENVQPEGLAALTHEHFRVLVFVGANQAKVPFETAAALQPLGARAEWVKIAGNGANALDFHIAYYIGQLAAADPTAFFHIVSKDTGFDALIAHLKAKKIFAGRVKTIGDIPLVKSATKIAPTDRASLVIEKLRMPKATKPRTVKTLTTHVAYLLQSQLSGDEVRDVIQSLVDSGFISIDGTKVVYTSAGDA